MLLMFCCFPLYIFSSTDSQYIEALDMDISKTGECRLTGRLSLHESSVEVAIVLLKGKDPEIDVNRLFWIDQVTSGNNGVFINDFKIPYDLGTDDFLVAVGASNMETAYKCLGKITVGLPPDLNAVNNNSVIVGRDAIDVTSQWYTANIVSSSIVFGGNRFYYKLGDLWYDLFDPKIDDNSKLIPENALDLKDVESIIPRYYYDLSGVHDLRYFVNASKGVN